MRCDIIGIPECSNLYSPWPWGLLLADVGFVCVVLLRRISTRWALAGLLGLAAATLIMRATWPVSFHMPDGGWSFSW